MIRKSCSTLLHGTRYSRRHDHSSLQRCCSRLQSVGNITNTTLVPGCECKAFSSGVSGNKCDTVWTLSTTMEAQMAMTTGTNTRNGIPISATIRRPYSGSPRMELSATTEGGDGKLRMTQEMDFFGEPITFLLPPLSSSSSSGMFSSSHIDKTMASLDTFIVSVLSRGKTAEGGGDDEGLKAKAAHSSAIAWSDLIQLASSWCFHSSNNNTNNNNTNKTDNNPNTMICGAPMVVASLLSPLLAQTGSAYVHHLDQDYLSKVTTKQAQPHTRTNLMDMAKAAVHTFHSESSQRSSDSESDMPQFSPRERFHLAILDCLLRDAHRDAMVLLLRLLEVCPGDALALSLAMDVASILGDRNAALRAAGSVASYWQDRGKRNPLSQPSIPCHSIGSSLIALGFAVGGRHHEAEQLADRALATDSDGTASGIAAWALAHAYDAQGRASEGNSLLCGFDGVKQYEDCGFLFFDSRLAGFGARFSLDRDGASADRTALRIYDSHFERVLVGTGYCHAASSQQLPMFRRVPKGKTEMMADAAGSAAKSFFGNFFSVGGNPSNKTDEGTSSKHPRDNDNTDDEDEDSGSNLEEISVQDVFTWLPPTPQLLTDATLLLLRLTISGSVKEDDKRWKDLRAAWTKLMAVQKRYAEDTSTKLSILGFSPLSRIASSLVLDDIIVDDGDNVHLVSRKLEEAANRMGKLMRLGLKEVDVDVRDDCGMKEDWKLVSIAFAQARDGSDVYPFSKSFESLASHRHLEQDFDGWQLDFRPFIEYSIFHAGCLSEDYEALCLARSICSEGVSLRPNSPETWWRYAVILEKLGDDAAADDAKAASVSLGSGEGGRIGVR